MAPPPATVDGRLGSRAVTTLLLVCLLCIATTIVLMLSSSASPSWMNVLSVAPTANPFGPSASLRPETQAQEALGSAPAALGLPSYTIHKAEPDNQQWPGGFYVVDVQHTAPAPDPGRFEDRNIKCYDAALREQEPYTELHKRRHAPPQALPGGVPRSFFRWEGNISREEFDAVPEQLPRGPKCVHCGSAIRYQVIEGHLYRLGGVPNWLVAVGEDVLLAAIHLWDLPDLDFIVHYDDSCPTDVPVLTWNICRDKHKAGFTFPSYKAWMFAMGPKQAQLYHQCLWTRYPTASRNPTVLWRGSTTDPFQPSFTIPVVDKVARMIVHKRFANDPVVDAKLSKVLFSDKCIEDYLAPLSPPMDLEDYNTAAIVMDMDGNGWSDRMCRTSHFPSPILKQASNHTAFFEHLLAPDHSIEYYHNDLSNLKARAYALIDEWKSSPARLQRQAEQRQGMALAMLNNMAVAEATAFSLLEYSKRITWQVKRDQRYEHIPFSRACAWNKLNKQLCEEIKSRPDKP